MPRHDLNLVAKHLTLQEGKRVSLPIGQVKEVLRLTLRWLAGLSEADALGVLARYRKRKEKP